MMKKLVILMLVLGLASTANAVLVPGMSLMVAQGTVKGEAPAQEDYYDLVDTELWLQPSDYLWIGVHNSIAGQAGATQKGLFILGIVEPSPDTAWTGNWAMYVPPLVPDAPDNEYWDVQDFGGGLILDMWLLTLTNENAGEYNGIGVLDAKELHCEEGPSDDVIALYDENMDFIDSIVIHQIPEPATIALLGLGGLLLRRCKRQHTV
jgi:hypothetical protein